MISYYLVHDLQSNAVFLNTPKPTVTHRSIESLI